jgi:glycerate kinase
VDLLILRLDKRLHRGLGLVDRRLHVVDQVEEVCTIVAGELGVASDESSGKVRNGTCAAGSAEKRRKRRVEPGPRA